MVNPGNGNFALMIRSDFVDKTDLISKLSKKLGTREQYICAAWPRRFGKSVNADMLVAFYSKGCDSAPLFAKLRVAADPCFKQDLNAHNVIWFDALKMIALNQGTNGIISFIQRKIIGELKKEFRVNSPRKKCFTAPFRRSMTAPVRDLS